MFLITAPFRTPFSLKTGLFHASPGDVTQRLKSALAGLPASPLAYDTPLATLGPLGGHLRQRRFASLDEDAHQQFSIPLFSASIDPNADAEFGLAARILDAKVQVEGRHQLRFELGAVSVDAFDNTIGLLCFYLYLHPGQSLEQAPHFDEATVELAERILAEMYPSAVAQPYFHLHDALAIEGSARARHRRDRARASLVRHHTGHRSFYDASLALDRETALWPVDDGRSLALLWAARIHVGDGTPGDEVGRERWAGLSGRRCPLKDGELDIRVGNSLLDTPVRDETRVRAMLAPYMKAQYFAALVSVHYFNIVRLQTECIADRATALGPNSARLYDIMSHLNATRPHLELTEAGLQDHRGNVFRQAVESWRVMENYRSALDAAKSLTSLIESYRDQVRQRYVRLVEIFLGALAIISALDFVNNLIWFTRSGDYDGASGVWSIYPLVQKFNPNIVFDVALVICLVASIVVLRASRRIERK